MANLSKLFNKLCCKIIILLAFMLIELLILIRKVKSSATRPITTKQYLKFIEEKNPTICYSKRLKARHVDCTVCLSEFKEGEKVRSLRCQHTFHRDCLDKWLQEYLATCPLCRIKVLPDDVVSKHRNHVGSGDDNGGGGGGDRLQFWLAALRGGNALNR